MVKVPVCSTGLFKVCSKPCNATRGRHLKLPSPFQAGPTLIGFNCSAFGLRIIYLSSVDKLIEKLGRQTSAQSS